MVSRHPHICTLDLSTVYNNYLNIFQWYGPGRVIESLSTTQAKNPPFMKKYERIPVSGPTFPRTCYILIEPGSLSRVHVPILTVLSLSRWLILSGPINRRKPTGSLAKSYFRATILHSSYNDDGSERLGGTSPILVQAGHEAFYPQPGGIMGSALLV
jgi:hypothetical protein